MFYLLMVNFAVHFDYESVRCTIKIENKSANRVLASCRAVEIPGVEIGVDKSMLRSRARWKIVS